MILSQLERSIKTTQLADQGIIGNLVIGFVDSAAGDILVDILKGFRERFPQIQLTLREMTSTQQWQALKDGTIHVGFLRRPAEQAVSVKLYETFLASYKESHPDDTILELDLFQENLPSYGNTAITGLYKRGQGWPLTPEEESVTTTIDRYMDQFLAADKVVFAFPLWNLMPPAPMVTYISYLAQSGKMFKYTSEGPVGLVPDKKAILLNARGGVYTEAPMGSRRIVRETTEVYSADVRY